MFPFNFFCSLQITENIGTTRAFDFKPIIWVDAGIHAREWISIAVAMKFIKRVRLRLVETGKNTQPTKCLRGLQSVCVCLVHKVAMCSSQSVYQRVCVWSAKSPCVVHKVFTSADDYTLPWMPENDLERLTSFSSPNKFISYTTSKSCKDHTVSTSYGKILMKILTYSFPMHPFFNP